jgi:O-antigen/teichoic acid export membrane protein
MNDLWRSIISTSGTRVYSALVGILALSITAKVFGPDGRGQLAAITTSVSLFATFGSLSLGQIAIHRAASAVNEGRPWLMQAFRVLACMTIIVSALGWALAGVLHAGARSFGDLPTAWLALGFLMLPMMVWEQHGNALLMARQELRISNRAQIVGRTLTVSLVAVLVGHAQWGVPGALVATLLGQLVVSGWTLVKLVPPSGPFGFPCRREIASYLRDGMKLHLNAVGAFLISGMDVLMVNYYSGPAETGLYQLGVQLTTLMLIVPQAAAMVAYGKVAQRGPDAAWRQHCLIMMQTTLFIVVIGVIAGLTAPWWLPVVAGPEFLPAAGLFRWQLLGVVGMTFSTMMAPQWIARGYFWQASLLTVAVGLANFLANLLLIPRYGMYGAVWAALGCHLLAIVGNGRMALTCAAHARKVGS